MGATTLYHPVSLPLLRQVLARDCIGVARVTQIGCNPLGAWAIYDARISWIGCTNNEVDLFTPRFVQSEVQSNCDQPGLRDGWSVKIEYVIWRGTGWTAHIKVFLGEKRYENRK